MTIRAEFAPPLTYELTVTVANAATDSDEADLHGHQIVGVFVPSGFDGTTLSFKAASSSGGTFVAVVDGAGNTITKTVAASNYLVLSPSDFAGIRFLKLVAGSQTGAAVFTLATRPV